MSLTCDLCERRFPTNTSLYIHKQTQHKPPKLLLMNHDHGDESSNNYGRKRKNDGNTDSGKKPKEDFKIIDEYNDGDNETENNFRKKIRKRKISNKKSKTKSKIRDRDDYNDGVDDNLEIIDQYNDDEGQDDPNMQINDRFSDGDRDGSNLNVIDKYSDDGQDNENLEIIDSYNDDDQDDSNLNVIDEYNDDGQDDNKLKIIDRYDHPRTKKKYNYKKLYEDCLKSSRKLRRRNKNIVYMSNKRYNELKTTSTKSLKNQQLKLDNTIKIMNEKCDDKIKNLEEKHNEFIKKMKMKYENEYKQLETECEEKIKMLQNHIKSLEEDDETVNLLSKAVFNCTSMKEIFEIHRLIKNHQLDLVVQRHFKTLQNIFLSLSFGILPICQPQREQISDDQRKLVENIQSVSQNRARDILMEHRQDLTNLFTIIEDSLKLARNSYNKYGGI